MTTRHCVEEPRKAGQTNRVDCLWLHPPISEAVDIIDQSLANERPPAEFFLYEQPRERNDTCLRNGRLALRRTKECQYRVYGLRTAGHERLPHVEVQRLECATEDLVGHRNQIHLRELYVPAEGRVQWHARRVDASDQPFDRDAGLIEILDVLHEDKSTFIERAALNVWRMDVCDARRFVEQRVLSRGEECGLTHRAPL